MNNIALNSPISISDIEAIERHCLEFSNQAQRLTGITGIDWENFEKNIKDSIRKLGIATLMFRKRIICVSGLQGAGKTTLMKNFYEIEDENFLCPNLDRGERIPILFTEDEKVSSPEAYAIMINYNRAGGNDRDVTYEKSLEPEEIQKYLKGTYDDVMYVEFRIPSKRICNSATSFLLLPGYEKKSDYWNSLIDFAVYSSDAAVFVFDSNSYAQKFNQEYLDRTKKLFGNRIIYVASRSDTSPDYNASFKETCLKELGIPADQDDRVVCVGAYSDDSKNREWINSFLGAIENHIVLDSNPRDKNKDYLKREFNKLRYEIMNAHKIISQQITVTDPKTKEIESYLNRFDKAVKERRKDLDKLIRAEYDKAKTDSINKLSDDFPGPIQGLKQKIFGVTPKDLIKREGLILKCLGVGVIDGNRIVDKNYIVGGTALGNSVNGYLMNREKNLTEPPLPPDVVIHRDEVASLMECPLKVDPKKLNELKEDVQQMLLPYNPAESHKLKSLYIQDVFGTIAELGTYYFCFKTYYTVAEKVHINDDFKPSQLAKVPDDFNIGDDMIAGMTHSQKFTAGIAGVLGIDLASDGVLDMGPAFAEALGLGAEAGPYVAAAIAAVVAAGAAVALVKDVNKIQREDLIACRNIICDVYDKLADNALDGYDMYIGKIRQRIEDNITKILGVGKDDAVKLNVQNELNYVTENIYRIISEL